MEEVNISTPSATAKITVSEANTLMGMRRGQLSAAADGETDPILWYAKAFMYPDCLACSTGSIVIEETLVPVKELTFEQYMALPDQVTEAWMEAVYTANPHWMPKRRDESAKLEQEKKA